MEIRSGIEVNCSSFNLINKTTTPLLAMPIEAWVLLAKAMGYQGIEWRPLRSHFTPEAQILSGLISSPACVGIRSVEQSFRTETSWAQASSYSDPVKRITAQQSFLALAPRVHSIRNMRALQRMVGKVNATVYPNDCQTTEGRVEWRKQQVVYKKLVQPGEEVVQKWHVSSFDAMLEGFEGRDLGINLDLAHYLRLRNHFPLPSMDDALTMMLPLMGEIQFSAKRNDLGLGDEDTNLAHQDLLDGDIRAEATQMFARAIEMGYSGSVVSEVAGSTSGNSPVKLFRDNHKYSQSLHKIIGRQSLAA